MQDTPITWQAIRDDCLGRIRAGEWAQGELIPNEADLAEEIGCARATVSRALRDLADAGYLDRRRRAGTRVAVNPVRKATLRIPVLQEEIEATGAAYGYALISRDMDRPPPAIRGQLGLPADARLLHVIALHQADGRPYAYEDRWVNPAAAPGLMNQDLANVSANAWLVRNVPYSEGTLAISAVAADARIAGALDCPSGAPLVAIERTTRTGDQPVTWVRQHYAPGHRLLTAI